jgi:hypothetical protein
MTNTFFNKKLKDINDLTGSFSELRDHFIQAGHNPDLVFQKVKDCIVGVLMMMEPGAIDDLTVLKTSCPQCYQVLGVDVIISDDLTAKVIEVNGLPSMQLGHQQSTKVPTPEDGPITDYMKLKFNMTRDVVRILLGRPDAAAMASLLSRAVRTAEVAGVLPNPLAKGNPASSVQDAGTFLDGCHLETACTSMIRFLGMRTFKGQFQDLYPGSEPLEPQHKQMLAYSASIVQARGRLTSPLYLGNDEKQREMFVTNVQFEERFGEFLRIAMQIQDKDKATSHGE